jgi:hypothetical protein
MRRTHFVLLPGLLLLGAVACGGGGKGGSGPPGGYTYEGSGRPVVNGWDPFAPAQDPSPSGTDFPACTGEGTVTLAQIIDAVMLPVCNLAATCGYVSTMPPPDQPQPAPSGGMSTRDLPNGEPPAYCESVYGAIDFDPATDGFAAVCDIFRQVSDALKRYPECNPPMVVPQGLCIDAVRACMNDIVSLGCNPTLDVPPRSCAGVSFGSSSSGGTTPPPADPCQKCLEKCGSDTDCQLNCYQHGPCKQD